MPMRAMASSRRSRRLDARSLADDRSYRVTYEPLRAALPPRDTASGRHQRSRRTGEEIFDRGFVSLHLRRAPAGEPRVNEDTPSRGEKTENMQGIKRTARPARAKKAKRPASPWRRGLPICAVIVVFIALASVGVVAGIVASYSNDLPDINRMADYQPSRSTRVFARDGSLLANLYRQNRTWVTIDKIPVYVRNAFIATEDRNFYIHHGVDLGG